MIAAPRNGRILALTLLAPACLFLLAAFVAPIASLLTRSVFDPGLTWRNYARMASTPVFAQVFGFSVELAAGATLLALLFGYPLAYVTALAQGGRRSLLLLLVLLPLWTNILVRCYAWMLVLQVKGLVNLTLADWLHLIPRPLPMMFNFAGALIGMVHYLMPTVVLLLESLMRSVDPRLMRVAESLGAPPWRSFLAVFVPQTWPGLRAAGLLGFISALGGFVIPALLGGPGNATIAMLINSEFSETMEWGFGSALCAALLTATVLLLVAYYLLQPGRAVARRAAVIPAGSAVAVVRTRWFARGAAALALVFLLLPLLVVVAASFNRSAMLQFPPQNLSWRWYQAFLGDPQWLAAFGRSVAIGAVVAACAVALATLAALGLMRRGFTGKGPLQAALLSPLLVPTVITGIGLFFLLSLLHLTDTWLAIIVGHIVLTVPYGIVVVCAALERLDAGLTQAAGGLGAGPFATFWRITLPLIRPAVTVAALFAFLISFDEVVVASFLAGPETETLPVKMWSGIRFDLDPTLAAVSTVLMVISGTLAALGEWLRRRGGQAMMAYQP